MQYEYHPAAALFPMMDREQFTKLADDIKANGLLEPIGIYEEKIIDGRNRFEACERAGVEPRFDHVTCQSPTIYVISKNLHRRHLSFEQRVAIGVNMLPLLEGEAKDRKVSHLKNQHVTSLASGDANGKSSEIAAAAVQVSTASIERGKAVKEYAPETFKKIEAGEIKVYPAFVQVRKSLQPQRVPYDVSTKRREQLANGQKDRIIEGLSLVGGACSALNKLDINKAASVLTKSDIEIWIDKARESRSLLGKLIAKLEGEINNGNYAKVEDHQSTGGQPDGSSECTA